MNRRIYRIGKATKKMQIMMAQPPKNKVWTPGENTLIDELAEQLGWKPGQEIGPALTREDDDKIYAAAGMMAVNVSEKGTVELDNLGFIYEPNELSHEPGLAWIDPENVGDHEIKVHQEGLGFIYVIVDDMPQA